MTGKRLLTSWHLWVMFILVIGAILLQNIIGGSTAFLLAFVLVCPIMMMFMMGGKDHKH